LAVRPAVLLMDEPLSALDSQTRELLMDDLVDLWEKERYTAAYVTHNLAEAVRLGHRIVVLSRRPGKIREIVEIDMPLSARTNDNAELDAAQKYVWNLMREEALAADRELLDVGGGGKRPGGRSRGRARETRGRHARPVSRRRLLPDHQPDHCPARLYRPHRHSGIWGAERPDEHARPARPVASHRGGSEASPHRAHPRASC